ncbi:MULTISPECIES: TonB-dependent receptor [Bacteroides]|jgi:TonB-linked SusC/RagA family outer membrane protein|uniref:SusC/RagA family TonB-linked outer membrane protein n=1 Tax=Bacteroides TaxID=816 RepID=UPI000E4AD21A|nr:MULTISPECIES: TonB-dependent receptor [Bacteroides]RHL09472.1 TonB-dependent receptor [Bacteroides sp. AF39-11AC]
MKNRKRINLFDHRNKSRWLFLFILLIVPLFSPIGVQQASAAVNTVQQQKKTITGTVVDSNGEAVIGANVVVKDNAEIGTITDLDGNFRLSNVPENAKLVISFIGYNTQTINVKGSILKITLEEDSQMLGEVEVVAYGVQKKVSVTGAISSVNGSELTKTPTGSVSNMLSGQMAGLTTVQYSGEPGSDAASIFVRGQATFNNSSPLIQVDGVERDFNEIDPNEIESISILKDASATAVFGVRGANGVVLITTKRGKEGKAKISISTSASIIAPTESIKMANSYQYATFYNQMLANDGKAPMFSDEIVQRFQDKSDPIRFPSVDWIDYCLKDMTLQTQHNVNISGGTERVRYFISAGAYTQGGLFKDFGLPYDLTYQYNRFNYRSNLDIDVTKTTTLTMNVAGNVNNSSKPYTGQGSAGMLINMYYSTPFSSPGFVDGKLVNTTKDYNDLRLPFTGGSGMSYYGGGFMKTSNNTLNADLQLKQKLDFITKGLSFHIKGSYNSGFTSYTQASASVATYTPVLQEDGSIAYKKAGQNSQLKYEDRDPGKSRNWYMEAALNYARNFGNHHVTGLVLYNQSKTYYPSTFSDIPQGYVGIVGRATYDWKNRYLAEINVGYNGSENFAPGKRFGTFPAGSFGWIVSEEKFWEPIKSVVNFLKFRYTIGLVGNDKIGGSRFMYMSDPYDVNNSSLINRDGHGFIFGINNSTASPGAYESSKNNADVTWEKALKTNYGVDVNFLDDRLRTSFDYYHEDRKDILLSDGTAPSVLGFAVPMANLGKMRSWGWEITLKWNDMIGKDFRYNVGLNLMYNQNRVVDRKEAPMNEEYMYQKGRRLGSRSQYLFFEYYNEDTTPIRYQEVYGVDMPKQLTDKLKNGDCVYVDLSGDGKIDANDASRDYGFTDDPEYMAGLNLGFSWKGFDFSMQWTAAWNVSRSISSVFRQPFTDRTDTDQGGLLVYMLDNTWTNDNPNPNAKYPRATIDNKTNNYAGSTLWEQDAKYIRLKNLQLAYNFNLPFMKKLKLNMMQLAFSGYNLLTFTPYIWGDPESRASNSPSYPLTKTYSLSLKLGF